MKDEIYRRNNDRRRPFVRLAAAIFMVGALAAIFIFNSSVSGVFPALREALAKALRDTFLGNPGKGHLAAEIPLSPQLNSAVSFHQATSSSPEIIAGTPEGMIPNAADRNRLVIAEVQIAGASSTNDFIKIFNPNGSSLDISGSKLRKRTQSGNEYSLRVFPSGSVIPAGGYFMWANSGNGFDVSVGADVSSGETLAGDNSIALLDANGAIIDALAWGKGHAGPFIEGSAYPANPTARQALVRQLAGGTIIDTDNNSADFAIR